MTMTDTLVEPTERFWNKVDLSGSVPVDPFTPLDTRCWLWQGHITRAGYGHFWDGTFLESGNPRMVRVHRWAYDALVGPIPDGLTIDHLCRVRHCVNPDHLEAVDSETNKNRAPITGGQANGRRQRSKTHCPQGHPYSGANLYMTPRGYRACRTCNTKRSGG